MLTTICRSEDLTVPPLVGCCRCDDVCMCIVNKQFELLEFVFDSVYVDMQYDEISLAFTSVSLCCVFGLCVRLWLRWLRWLL